MINSVPATDASRGITMNISARGLASGSVLSGGNPIVALVLTSEQGEFMGSLEVSPMDANILGEFLRVAAEAANQTAK